MKCILLTIAFVVAACHDVASPPDKAAIHEDGGQGADARRSSAPTTADAQGNTGSHEMLAGAGGGAGSAGNGGAGDQPGKLYRISGTVAGEAVKSVTMMVTGAAEATATTDDSGNYAVRELGNGAYTVTPVLQGYVFSPASRAVSIESASVVGADFKSSRAAGSTHSIFGTVSGAVANGITINLFGNSTAAATTDASGKYTFSNLADGDYKLVPSLSGYSFLPNEKTVSVAGANVEDANFSSASTAQATYSIAGFVIGDMLDGVTIRLTGAASATATLDNGRFVFSNLSDGMYTVTPALPGSTFEPASKSVTIKGAAAEDQGFGMCSSDKWCFQILNVNHNALNAIWARSSTDVWAVGAMGTVIRWNGSSWLEVTGAPSEELKGVWGSGPNDVWIVGRNNTVLRWDGTKLKNIPAEPQNYTAVWGSGPDDVWLSGSTNTLRWNGSSFTTLANYADGYTSYAQMWGSSQTDVWAVGPGILRWNGMAWTLVTNDAAANDQNIYYSSGIWAAGPTNIWIVDQGGSIFHWSGATWTRELNTSDVKRGFEGIWGSGSNDIWAVGASGTLVHWDGNSWRAASSGTAKLITDISGTGANDAWATTDRNILRYTGK